jgi:hypothetical protein
VRDGAGDVVRTRAGRANDDVERGNYYMSAAAVAKEIAPYRFPRLSTVKVGGDKGNPVLIREGVTAQEVREELLRDIAETGLIPSQLRGLLEPPTAVVPSNGSNGRKKV